MTDTLILDEDGLYDPSHFNDRLLLGLKGTISEAELHVLRARLRGGILNKARRGELKMTVPLGLVYDAQDHVVLDPDRQVQQSLRTLFATFERIGSAMATVKYFREQGLLFPRRLTSGTRRGELLWGPLVHSCVLRVLHNPRFAGAFVHGRTRSSPGHDGRRSSKKLPIDQWQTLLPEAHVGYITWEQFLRNQQRLRENAQAQGSDRGQSPPGEGPALLQGLILCGICGQRMTVRYHSHDSHLIPRYTCQRKGIEHGQQCCQTVPGAGIDMAIGGLLLEMMTPVTLEVAMAVQQQLQEQVADADRLRRQQVERARYEADLARQRFMQVDPQNRFVADSLEAEWNEKLRVLNEAQENYQQQQQADRAVLDDASRKQILNLATDFPKLWRAPQTPVRERKRIVRLLIEDVTLCGGESISVHVRFKGGATRTLTVPRPQPVWMTCQTSAAVLAEIDRLLDNHTEGEIATILNNQRCHSGKGCVFTCKLVGRIRRRYHLKSRFARLREIGMLTVTAMAERFGVTTTTINIWRRSGMFNAHACNDKNMYLYQPPDGPQTCKSRGMK